MWTLIARANLGENYWFIARLGKILVSSFTCKVLAC